MCDVAVTQELFSTVEQWQREHQKPKSLRGTRQAQAHVIALLEIIGNARLLPIQVKILALGAAICQAFHLRAHCTHRATQNDAVHAKRQMAC